MHTAVSHTTRYSQQQATRPGGLSCTVRLSAVLCYAVCIGTDCWLWLSLLVAVHVMTS